MKLTGKLVFTLMLAMMLILAVNSWLQVRREVELFRTDMKKDAEVIGSVLADSMRLVWRINGELEAKALVMAADRGGKAHIHLRWQWLGPADLHIMTSHRIDGKPAGVFVTDVPVQTPDGRWGAIEVSESLAPERAYVRATVRNTLFATGALVAICGLLATALGVVFVGRPTRLLVMKARRVGAGDLSGPLHLKQRDELGEVSAEMNAMCDRLAVAQAQLQHADRLMTVGKLASGIAHEMGTPLNVVAGRAQMIASGEITGSDVQDNARIIVEQSQRMTRIIRQLLDFARRRGTQKAETDLHALAERTAALLGPMAQKQGVEVAVTGDAAAKAVVDEAQVQQALTNLVVNAIQATPSGGRVTVGFERRTATPPADVGGPAREALVMTVADTGSGMDPETSARIFEPFFTTKEVGEGTGLGLSVTYGIIREHGGWISVDSKIGEGSTFTVCIP